MHSSTLTPAMLRVGLVLGGDETKPHRSCQPNAHDSSDSVQV
jgi:hypothetical protein